MRTEFRMKVVKTAGLGEIIEDIWFVSYKKGRVAKLEMMTLANHLYFNYFMGRPNHRYISHFKKTWEREHTLYRVLFTFGRQIDPSELLVHLFFHL